MRARLLAALTFASVSTALLAAPSALSGSSGMAAVVRLTFVSVQEFSTGCSAKIDVVVTPDPDVEIQAWSLDFEWDPDAIIWAGAKPHPEFDDDGVLFLPPALDSSGGELRDVVDLRHGAPASGETGIASLHVWARRGTESAIFAHTKIAGPGGEYLSTVIVYPTLVCAP